jgi:hypothetical protein
VPRDQPGGRVARSPSRRREELEGRTGEGIRSCILYSDGCLRWRWRYRRKLILRMYLGGMEGSGWYMYVQRGTLAWG